MPEILVCSVSKTDSCNVTKEDVKNVKNFYYKEKDNRSDLVDAYNELEKNGACDEDIWKQLIEICQMMKK